MQITWTDNKGKEVTGRIDASLWPIVRTIGVAKAARFFLFFGGSYIYVPSDRVQDHGGLTRMLGRDDALALIKALRDQCGASGAYRVPLADVFLARYLRSTGRNINQISRRLRRTDVTVRGFLKPDDVRRATNSRNKDQFARGDGSP